MGEGKYAVTASKFYGVPINMMHNGNKVRLTWFEKYMYNSTKGQSCTWPDNFITAMGHYYNGTF